MSSVYAWVDVDKEERLENIWCGKKFHAGLVTPPWSQDALQDYDPAARKAIVQLFACDDFCQMARRDMVRVSAWELSRRANCLPWNIDGTWEHVSLMWRLVEPAPGVVWQYAMGTIAAKGLMLGVAMGYASSGDS